MQVNPYLFFNGQCEAAFRFYEEALGGKITAMMSFADAPAGQGGPESQNGIMHACLEVGEGRLMGSDDPGGDFKAPKGFYVQIAIGKVSDAERVFSTLAKGGKVNVPFEQSFWATRFGMLVDQFGIPWMVNCYEGMEQGVGA
ncbi:MAG: VOC family protein [Gemmatimonadales bacterium]